MIGRLRAFLAKRRDERRRRRRYFRKYEAWQAANPGGTYGQFYALYTREGIDRGQMHPTLGISSVDHEVATRRGRGMLASLIAAGCEPHHRVVDDGCGSLWIGEALMNYLDPGGYIGLDVSDTFYAEALTRIPATLVADRKPMLAVIDDLSLAEARRHAPDFIIAIQVMHHVPPAELKEFFARIVSLAAPHTRIDVTAELGWWTASGGPKRWRHGRYAVRGALAELGCSPEFSMARRIDRTRPGFAIVRR